MSIASTFPCAPGIHLGSSTFRAGRTGAASVPESPRKRRYDTARGLNIAMFALLFFGTCYVAREILVPIVLALLLALLLTPSVNLLARVHVPRAIGSLLIVATVVAA